MASDEVREPEVVVSGRGVRDQDDRILERGNRAGDGVHVASGGTQHLAADVDLVAPRGEACPGQLRVVRLEGLAAL